MQKGLKEFQKVYDEAAAVGLLALDLAQDLSFRYESAKDKSVTEEDVHMAYGVAGQGRKYPHNIMEDIHELAKALGFTREDYIDGAKARRREGNCNIKVIGGGKSINKNLNIARGKLIRPNWDEYFMGIARMVAQRSTCPRASVGAVIVKDNRILATGYNGSPGGEPHCIDIGCLMEDDHCQRAVHAETNAIAQAAKFGIAVDGATLYYSDSLHRSSNSVEELNEHCHKCGLLAKAVGIMRVMGR